MLQSCTVRIERNIILSFSISMAGLVMYWTSDLYVFNLQVLRQVVKLWCYFQWNIFKMISPKRLFGKSENSHWDFFIKKGKQLLRKATLLQMSGIGSWRLSASCQGPFLHLEETGSTVISPCLHLWCTGDNGWWPSGLWWPGGFSDVSLWHRNFPLESRN